MDIMCPPGQSKEFKLLNLVRRREICETSARLLPYKLRVTRDFVSRLGLEKELEGHKGCVNCLEWNETGQILASASDDMHLILWDPFRYEKKLAVRTGHNGNIFSVKFMPKSSSSILVTGAGDNGVRIHDVALSNTILVCNCHTGRVKRIATAESVPYLFWSAAEDGIVLQYDMRMPHRCKPDDQKNILINLSQPGRRKMEAKCLAINPVRPELVAVGANDPYVRVYDRRMIKFAQDDVTSACPNVGAAGNSVPLEVDQYFIAGHLLSADSRDIHRNFATTYLTFSADGTELLVNMGGEQIYLFDINRNKTKLFESFLQRHQSVEIPDTKILSEEFLKTSAYGVSCKPHAELIALNVTELPEDIEAIKQEANQKFHEQHYTYAVNLYNKALNLCPYASVLYANRAAAYMKRGWDGDIYSALRDCQITLLLDPNHVKAHFRLARCLHILHRPRQALRVLVDFQEKFLHYAYNLSYQSLEKDINDALLPKTDSSEVFSTTISPDERNGNLKALDYSLRFCGHCNTTTDIKEVNFYGDDKYILAGSDDGSFFIWDRETTNIVKILRGDRRIVNCLQPHPSTCLLATSGIDPVIRLWSPLPEDGRVNDREIENLQEAASANQIRMNSDPFELMMISMGYRIPGHGSGDDDDEDHAGETPHPVNCRPS